jgi:hypothetical protein
MPRENVIARRMLPSAKFKLSAHWSGAERSEGSRFCYSNQTRQTIGTISPSSEGGTAIPQSREQAVQSMR